MVAVVLGTAAGAGLTFMVTSRGAVSPPSAASPVAPVEVAPTPPAAPTPTVFVENNAPKPDPTAVEASADSAEAAAPSASASASKGSRPGARSTPARVPSKKVAKGRDYGI
jgi:hypothetical protein